MIDNDVVQVDLLHDYCSMLEETMTEIVDISKLDNKPDRDKLLVYYNLYSRLIHPKPRNVHYSQEFKVPEGYEEKCKKLIHAIRIGSNLKPYLSKKVESDPVYIDKFLNRIGVHHLHIEDQFNDDGFVKRSDYLLIALFQEDDAYLLSIVPHSCVGWTNVEYIRLIHRNWMHLLSLNKVNGQMAETFSDEVLSKILEGSVNVTIKIDGSFFVLPMVTNSGHSMAVVRQCIDIERCFVKLEKQLQADVCKDIEKAIRKSIKLPLPCQYELIEFDPKFSSCSVMDKCTKFSRTIHLN